jgi:excisionase family DNA binding protein
MEHLLLRPEEAAEVLAIGRNKVFELLAAGELESVRVGGSRRVPMACLVEFVARLRHAGSAAAQLTTEAIGNGRAMPGVVGPDAMPLRRSAPREKA